jgi:tetratricopeptide (TPR) repeat protein
MLSVLVFVYAIQASPGDWVRSALEAEEAGRYAEAVSWYSRVQAEAPTSYASRKSAVRLRELEAFADHGFVPYARYQAILTGYASLSSDRALAEARSIVADFPAAAVTPHVMFWIANEYAEGRGEFQTALESYRVLIERYPDHELAPRALDLTGRIYERLKRFGEAERVYAELEAKYPNANAPEVFAKRRALLQQGLRRKLSVKAANWTLAVGGAAFLLVGGWRIRRESFWRHARGKVAFSLALGIPPAAFLWVYDGIWSPSLTHLSIAFAGYSLILAALAARSRPPGKRWIAGLERLLFGVVIPVAILVLVVAKHQLWEAFGL